MIYFLSGAQIFSTSNGRAKVPITIEADPKIVNLYIVIVTRDDNGVQGYEIRNISKPNDEYNLKEEVAKILATDYGSPDLRQQQPDFEYQTAVKELPQKSLLRHIGRAQACKEGYGKSFDDMKTSRKSQNNSEYYKNNTDFFKK